MEWWDGALVDRVWNIDQDGNDPAIGIRSDGCRDDSARETQSLPGSDGANPWDVDAVVVTPDLDQLETGIRPMLGFEGRISRLLFEEACKRLAKMAERLGIGACGHVPQERELRVDAADEILLDGHPGRLATRLKDLLPAAETPVVGEPSAPSSASKEGRLLCRRGERNDVSQMRQGSPSRQKTDRCGVNNIE